MILLHGDDIFQQNWFFWTEIRLFSPENRGGNVLYQDLYLRLLLAMVIAGIATACKRTVLALYFGKKTVLNYKPQMDKILADMAIVSEVGQLASEAASLVEAAADNEESINAAVVKKMGQELSSGLQWKNVDSLDTSSEEGSARGGEFQITTALDEMEEIPETAEADQTRQLPSADEAGNESLTSSDDNPDSESEEEEDSSDELSDTPAAGGAGMNVRYYSSREAQSLSSKDKRFKNLLDRWDEPESASDKVSLPTQGFFSYESSAETHT